MKGTTLKHLTNNVKRFINIKKATRDINKLAKHTPQRKCKQQRVLTNFPFTRGYNHGSKNRV